jgi:ABC-type microcin C transport system duplicated ATPase subunit YejF
MFAFQACGGSRTHRMLTALTSSGEVIDFDASGSSGWTRTSNPPVNRLMQVLFLDGSSLA